ncbi:S8 family serine peptidase [bacterium]|nr:S8 family serine peptidase [bacterium]
MNNHKNRSVESEQLLFEVLMKFREHRELEQKLRRGTSTNLLRLRRGSEMYGPCWLQDLTVLMLYHGTELSPKELVSLRRADIDRDENGLWRIRSPLKDEWYVVSVENELSSVLEACLIALTTDRESDGFLFRSRSGGSFHEHDVLQLVERFSERPAHGTLAPYFSLSADDFAVIPTPLRLNANPRYTGQGITIAFIDSGFYPHPDLVKPVNRILAYVDMSDLNSGWSELAEPVQTSWHGMQTSVSACGNGFLSQGLYRGIASEANVVLIKASSGQNSKRDLISAGLEWAIEHKTQYNIRIINISLGTGLPSDSMDNPVNKAVAEAVAAGIVVVVAAGNDPHKPPVPPANALSAITVGGTDDQNTLFQDTLRMYHSSYGSTIEGVVKPEIIAPAIWIAAPILPGSALYYESLAIQKLMKALDHELIPLFKENRASLRELPVAKKQLKVEQIRQWAEQRTKSEKLIATHYQHVDGTSFAAPITASVIAQMLQVNPELSPENIKKILIATARHLDGISPFVQGYGVISPFEAVEAALMNNIPQEDVPSSHPRIYKNKVTFHYTNPQATSVDLVGDFNQWQEGVTPMVPDQSGTWHITHEFLLPGRYRYKFIVDGRHWLHDPLNSRQENDGYNGHNSIFYIHSPGNAEEIFERFLKTIRLTTPEQIEIRRNAFQEIDQILQLPLSNRSYRVRQFFARCMTIAFEEIEQEQMIETDHLKVWQFYNQGYIVKTSGLTLAFDLVTTRHVYNVFWNLEPTIVSTLADLIDILFVTHRHPDHFDLELINTLISRGKRVIIPHEFITLLPRGAIGLKPDEHRSFTFPTKQDETLKVMAHQGQHVYDQGRKIPHRVYEIETAQKYRLLHLGDHDYASTQLDLAPCHLGFVKLGSISPDFNDVQAFKKLTRHIRFQHIIAGHINELGHPVKGGRIGYENAFQILSESDVPASVLAWGEAFSFLPELSPTAQSTTRTSLPKKQKKKHSTPKATVRKIVPFNPSESNQDLIEPY